MSHIIPLKQSLVFVLREEKEVSSHKASKTMKTSRVTPLFSATSKIRLKRMHPCWEQVLLVVIIVAWYVVGALAIVTTKLLVTAWRIPPLLLTVQQLFLASSILRTVLAFGKRPQPWPMDNRRLNRDFLLVGLFNAFDFLLSNSAFHASAASFVETIKASEPITTTVVALAWQVDRLELAELACLVLLITGVLLSTVGNAGAAMTTTTTDGEAVMALGHSARTAASVMTANLCFAFRALSQKRYRSSRPAAEQLDDINLAAGGGSQFTPSSTLDPWRQSKQCREGINRKSNALYKLIAAECGILRHIQLCFLLCSKSCICLAPFQFELFATHVCDHHDIPFLWHENDLRWWDGDCHVLCGLPDIYPLQNTTSERRTTAETQRLQCLTNTDSGFLSSQ